MPAILAHWMVAKEVANFNINYMPLNANFFSGNDGERYNGVSKFLYLGSNGPDIPYFRHSSGKSQYADLFHYNKQCDFIVNFIKDTKSLNDPFHQNRLMSYILGHTTHLIADSEMHPYVNRFAGAYHSQPVDDLHKISELHQDSWLAHHHFGRDYIDEGESWTMFVPDRTIEVERLFESIDATFHSTYKSSPGTEYLNKSYFKFYEFALDIGYDWAAGPIPKKADNNLVDHKHLPVKYYDLLKGKTVDKAMAACNAVIQFFNSDMSNESENIFRSQIKNWNMDTGYWIDIDLKDGELNITWKHTWCN